MSIKAEIIADSVNPVGCRLTTYILEYPRFIHSEIMTHRVFSKNAASSRAIPIEKMIQQVIDNPAMPVWWGKNQSGMQAKDELDSVTTDFFPYSDTPLLMIRGYYKDGNLTAKEKAKQIWLEARDEAIKQVRRLNGLGLHKQIANRILEPWFNIRVIFSGTEFDNFYELRAHPDAQPEFQALAYKMLEEHKKSTPKQLKHGEWHIPFGDKIDEDKIVEETKVQKDEAEFEVIKRKIAIARCARVSYHNYEGKDDYLADVKLCDRLFSSKPKHLSPTEHVAQALESDQFIGNFRGFKQYRKFIETL